MMNVLVRNRSGVLQRVTGLFSRRGYNIQSIYAEQTKNPEVSRIVIEVAGDDHIISQVEKQLAKLVDVLSIHPVSDMESIVEAEQPVINYKNSHAVSEITVLDTTLRDGAQGEGVAFTAADKLSIIKALDRLGIPLIEAGSPGENSHDLEVFEQAKALGLKHAQLAAFGMTCRSGKKPEEDPGIQALLKAGTRIVTLFGKSWEIQLDTTPEENLRTIAQTVQYLVEKGRTVLFDAGHFFDGFKANSSYAIETLHAAEDAGASCIVLCDTNGGAFPEEIGEITAQAAKQVRVQLGIHCHDDMGCAVAGSLAAVSAGASHLQGSCIGLGERCGNANLSALIPTLQLKRGLHCIPQANMKRLTSTALFVSDVANVSLLGRAPYVGKSAFAHKSGMHVDGVEKDPSLYEHIKPETVGNKRNILVSGLGGKTALFAKINELLPDIDPDSPEAEQLTELLRSLESEGYQFEAALASMELAMLKRLGRFEPFFTLVDFKIIGEMPKNADSGMSTAAMVKIKVKDAVETTAEDGDGPVHALDLALRKAVQRFYPELGNVRLTDYKVRVIDPKDATAAKVRVLVESTDGETSWTTVGVSSDVIHASLHALVDSIEYKLFNDSRRQETEDEDSIV